MDMNEKLHSGVLYLPDDDDIIDLQEKCLEKLYDFNMTRPREMEKRSAMLKDMFAEIGEEVKKKQMIYLRSFAYANS